MKDERLLEATLNDLVSRPEIDLRRPVTAADWSSWASAFRYIRRSKPIRSRRIAVVAMIAILDPFEDVADHVVEAKFVGGEPAHGRRLLFVPLAAAERVLVVTDTKKAPVVEVPLTIPMIQELRELRDVSRLAHPDSRFMFPSFSKRGHLVEWKRYRSELSHWGNSGRHTRKTIASDTGVNDLISDLLEGRQLKRAGLASRGYINRAAPHYTALREGQRRISAEVAMRLFAA